MPYTIKGQSNPAEEIKPNSIITETQAARWNQLVSLYQKTHTLLFDIGEQVMSQTNIEEARQTLENASNILRERKFTFIFFGGTGVGKSTLVNAFIGRKLLPTDDGGSVTGTITTVEQEMEGENERLVVHYWTAREFSERVKFLCGEAGIPEFDVRNEEERSAAKATLIPLEQADKMDEKRWYYNIIKECIDLYTHQESKYKEGKRTEDTILLKNKSSYDQALRHIWEGGLNKADRERQIRLIKTAQFFIHPPADNPDLFLNGNLRLVDVPGLGATMQLHREITRLEMKDQDAMIGLVLNSRRVSDGSAKESFEWISKHHLSNLPEGEERNNAAAKIFLIVNLSEEKEGTFTKLRGDTNDLIRDFTEAYLSKNYWEKYRHRGKAGLPFFIVSPRPALYVQGVDEREYKDSAAKFARDFLGIEHATADSDSGLRDNKDAIWENTEMGLLRQKLNDFIRKERVNNKLNEAAASIRQAMEIMKNTLNRALEEKGVNPDTNKPEMEREAGEKYIEEKFDQLELDIKGTLDQIASQFRDDSDSQKTTSFTSDPDTLTNVTDHLKKQLTKNTTEYRNHLTQGYGEEHALMNILSKTQTELNIKIFQGMPKIAMKHIQVAEILLFSEGILKKLTEAAFGQDANYLFSIPYDNSQLHPISQAYHLIIQHLKENYKHAFQQAVMYELVNNAKFHLLNRYDEKYKNEQSQGMNNIEEQITACVEQIPKDLIGHDALSKGTKRLFRWELDKLERALLKLSGDLRKKIEVNFEHDKDMRERILKTDTDTLAAINRLFDFQRGLEVLENELNTTN